MRLNLITSFYVSKNYSRNTELIKALKNNIQSEHIECIHLFVDNEIAHDILKKESLLSDKVLIINIGQQPLYSDLFSYANKLCDKLSMIANSDIWLYNIEDSVLDKIQKNEIYALTRYESDMSSPLIDKYEGSHDAFIFHSPINESIIKHIKFPQNVWGSENVLMYEIIKLNYNILNPCRQIKIVHEHMSCERNEDRITINCGDIDGDGVFQVRSHMIAPSII